MWAETLQQSCRGSVGTVTGGPAVMNRGVWNHVTSANFRTGCVTIIWPTVTLSAFSMSSLRWVGPLCFTNFYTWQSNSLVTHSGSVSTKSGTATKIQYFPVTLNEPACDICPCTCCARKNKTNKQINKMLTWLWTNVVFSWLFSKLKVLSHLGHLSLLVLK